MAKTDIFSGNYRGECTPKLQQFGDLKSQTIY